MKYKNMKNKFTNKTNPVLKFPWRSPLQIIDAIKPYIEGKVVCDLGCACGDILYAMKDVTKEIVGVEFDIRFKEQINSIGADRDFILWGDLFKMGVPKADVYFLWISPDVQYNKRIIDMIQTNKLIIDVTSRLELFKDFKNLTLMDVIEYEYDETNCYGYVKGFEPTGKRIVRIYKKI